MEYQLVSVEEANNMYVRRGAIFDCIEEAKRHFPLTFANGLDVAWSEIQKIPVADVQEIVRCKDCKFTKRDGCDPPAIYCEKWDRWEMPEDAYCYLGKRK